MKTLTHTKEEAMFAQMIRGNVLMLKSIVASVIGLALVVVSFFFTSAPSYVLFLGVLSIGFFIVAVSSHFVLKAITLKENAKFGIYSF